MSLETAFNSDSENDYYKIETRKKRMLDNWSNVIDSSPWCCCIFLMPLENSIGVEFNFGKKHLHNCHIFQIQIDCEK